MVHVLNDIHSAYQCEVSQTLILTGFYRVDADNNGKLSLVEISNWIEKKIKEHMDAAVKENSNLFKILDADHDGENVVICIFYC